jgi:hypothetical protein
MRTKNNIVFITDKINKKIFLQTSTKSMRPSAIFCRSYPLFSTVIFRETTSTEHTNSVLFLILFSRIVSDRNF